MSKIEDIREFIAGCPYIATLINNIHVDWTDSDATTFGIMPTGESTIQSFEDVCGNKIKYYQANFVLYATKFTIDDIIRLENAAFLENFAAWIDEQSAAGTIPHWGDDPEEEEMSASNGMLYEVTPGEKSGCYQIQIACRYKKTFERIE